MGETEKLARQIKEKRELEFQSLKDLEKIIGKAKNWLAKAKTF